MEALGMFGCAMLIGLDKGGIPGLGALGMAFVLSRSSDKYSIGHSLALFVPVLAVADVFAIFAYRNHIDWIVIRGIIIPFLSGISLGFLVLGNLPDAVIRQSAGFSLLLLSACYNFSTTIQKGLQFSTTFRSPKKSILPSNLEDEDKNLKLSTPAWNDIYSFSGCVCFGFISGLLTVVANIAGPVVAVYLISLQLPKRYINGTRALLFTMANAVKIPGQIILGNLTMIDINFVIPLAIVAALTALLTEAYLIAHIKQAWFERVAWIFVTISALKLVLNI